MRCEFIKAHGGEFGPIGKACEILRVSKSEYYDCLNRPKSNAQTEREALGGFVVGWSMSDRITEKLAIDALAQAVGREGPPDDFSLVFHDDRGPNTPRAHFRDASSRTGWPSRCQGLEIRGTMRWPSRSSRRSSES